MEFKGKEREIYSTRKKHSESK